MKNTQSIIAGIIFLTLLSSCSNNPNSTGRNYMPDMTYAVSYETNSVNPLFSDNETTRQPVAGTIPRGTFPENDTMSEAALKSFLYKRYYADTPDGYEKAGAELVNPVLLNDQTLAEGKKVYDIYCMVCHGQTGDGQGSIVQSGAFPPVPDYKTRLKGLAEGKMFHSITYGRNLMGSYSAQVSPEDRWKVIYYIQKLSATGRFAVADTAGTAAAAK